MWTSRLPARSSVQRCLVSGFCSSGRDFAPRFLQTVPRGSALALHSCFTSIRLHGGLSPPDHWACPAHRTSRAKRGGPEGPSLSAPPRAGLTIARSGRRNGLLFSRTKECLVGSGRHPPVGAVAHHRVQRDQKLAHAG